MSKNIWIVVVVVAIAAGVWWFEKGGQDMMQRAGDASPTPSVSTAAGSKAKPAAGAPAATQSPYSGKTYSQLVAEFGGNRLQFDQRCQANPARMVVKNGVPFMLDNRANEARSIKFNNQSYNLGPYGYQVVTLSGAGTYDVTCNVAGKVGTLLLEAVISQ